MPLGVCYFEPMSRSIRRFGTFMVAATTLIAGGFATVAYASHSWGNYHWANTVSPFTLQLGDNVSAVWDGHLVTASSDWSLSNVLDTSIQPGQTNPKNCRPRQGRVEVCNSKYGGNGWLGLASIWISGGHITQGTVKLNDTYFNKEKYNTPAWRQFVMCQEIGHTFGLDHQDENFDDPNMGTCMDYTDNPSGPPSNEFPNVHDFDQLELIYAHLDSVTTVGQVSALPLGNGNADDFGRVLRQDSRGRPSLYGRDLGNGEKLFTFVFWANS